MMGRVLLRRLCALVILAVVVVAPPQLLMATCNVPRQVAAVLADVGGSPGGLCVSSSATGSLIGFVALSVWVYLVLIALLRAIAVLGTWARVRGSARLLVATNHFAGGGWVRRLVDVAVGVGLVAATAGHVSTPSGDPPGTVAGASAPVHAASLGEQVGELLGLDVGRPAAEGASDQRERLYTVRPGDTLALVAERELGDADLWAWLFELNEGRLMPDGQRLQWPDELRAGWVLVLPSADEVGVPPASTGEGAPPVATTSPQTGPPPASTPQGARPPGVAIELPSGSVVAFSLWVAVSSALLLVLLRRRRSRRPESPEPGICRYRPEEAGVAEQVVARGWAASREHEADETTAADASGEVQSAGPAFLPVPPLSDLTCVDPGRVAVGERNGESVELDLSGVGLLALNGPRAAEVAYAAVVTMLAQHGPLTAEVLVVGDLLQGVPKFPGFERAADLTTALSRLEVEVIHRTRLLEREEVDDFTAHRRDRPDEQLPAMVLLTDQVPFSEAGRLEVLAAQGSRLGIGTLVVATDLPGAARIEMEATGRVVGAEPPALAGRLAGSLMYFITAAEAADLLSALARARADLPESVTPLEPSPEPFDPPAQGSQPPLRVRLLGVYRVETAGGVEIRAGLRRKALELLAFYLLNPDGATQEQAVASLWPDTPFGREAQWFWNALGNLRTVVRDVTGERRLDVISRDRDRYRPDPEVFDVDLWRFESGLKEAKQAAAGGDTEAEARALAAAAEAYGGELLRGNPDMWVTVPREDLRRRAVGAFARLAELREAAGDDEGALAALHGGLGAEPVAEELCQRAMRLYARLGRRDEVRRVFKELERHLADLDLDPDPETQALLAELLTQRRTV